MVTEPLHHQKLLLSNINVATMVDGFHETSLVRDAAVEISDGKISRLGLGSDAEQWSHIDQTIDGGGRWLLPGFIDCHTHLVFGGNRADEFEMRLQGKSYAEIAQAGGGIVSTVTATRAASFDDLLSASIKRARAMLKNGVTTIEIKSGYGLDLETEKKMLEVARKIPEFLHVDVVTTFLGAHAVPSEFKQDPDAYIEVVMEKVLPEIAGGNLADAVDVFCESIGFNLEQSRKVLETAQQLGLPIKAHVEQLSNLGGSELAASMNALSVDHIEYLDEKGVLAIAKSGTIATLLPGAFYFLNETQKPPVELLRKHKVPMAVATDFNPGSSPVASLPLMLNMACVMFGLTPEEALMGVTQNAAKALGLDDKVGTIEVGKQADLVLWDIEHPKQLCYEVGLHKPERIFKSGRSISP